MDRADRGGRAVDVVVADVDRVPVRWTAGWRQSLEFHH